MYRSNCGITQEENRKNLKRPVRPRGKKTDFGERLRELVGPVHMVKSDNCRPFRMTNKKYCELRNQHGRHFDQRLKLSYHTINAHERGETALKVSARHGGKTLLYFDFDTHHWGSANDVAILAQIVRDVWPTMPEFVYSPRGGSGWLVVDTTFTQAEEYNGLVKRLELFFRSIAKSMNLEIELVEVMGCVYLPEFDDRGLCVFVKAGHLLKCPPSLEYLEQPAINADTFHDSKFDPWVTSSTVNPVENKPAENNPVRSDNSCGSFKPRLLSDDHILCLPAIDELVAAIFADRPTKIKVWGISTRQFTELLLAMYLLPENADGSNPYSRHKEFIDTLCDEGVFLTRCRPERHKAVRDYLSSKGGIAWEDNNYQVGRNGEMKKNRRTGRTAVHKDGKATKWGLDPVLRGQIAAVLGEEIHTQYTLIPTCSEYTGKNLRPQQVTLPETFAEKGLTIDDMIAAVIAGTAA